MPRKITFHDFQSHIYDGLIIILVEHLGDIIACEPVIRYAKKTWPGKTVAWLLLDKYAEVFAGHPDLDYIVETPSLWDSVDGLKDLPETAKVMNLHFSGRVCPVTRRPVRNDNRPDIDGGAYLDHGSLLEAFSLIAGLPALTDAPQYYFSSNQPKPEELPERYIVFHCRSNDEKKDWTYENWMKLFSHFAGQGIGVAEIGLEPVLNLDDPLYYDMTQVRSIDRIAKIIQGSEFFFGIDSAFAHLANAVRKNGLVILGKYADWNRYCPYTGPYSRGHTIGYKRLPARYLEAEKVVARYEKIMAEGYENTPAQIERTEPDGFPNGRQMYLLKHYRSLVKRTVSSQDFQLYCDDPGVFFVFPGRAAPLAGFMRRILSLLGPVPPRLAAVDEF